MQCLNTNWIDVCYFIKLYATCNTVLNFKFLPSSQVPFPTLVFCCPFRNIYPDMSIFKLSDVDPLYVFESKVILKSEVVFLQWKYMLKTPHGSKGPSTLATLFNHMWPRIVAGIFIPVGNHYFQALASTLQFVAQVCDRLWLVPATDRAFAYITYMSPPHVALVCPPQSAATCGWTKWPVCSGPKSILFHPIAPREAKTPQGDDPRFLGLWWPMLHFYKRNNWKFSDFKHSLVILWKVTEYSVLRIWKKGGQCFPSISADGTSHLPLK